jgi:hypothetical protein
MAQLQHTPADSPPPPDPGALQIRLGTLAEVFTRPPFDPFAGLHEERSGMERLEADLAGRRRGQGPAAVEWLVPAAEANGVDADALRRAVSGWCAAQSAVTRDGLAAHASERRHAIIVGGIFFIICFALATGFDATGAAESLGISLLTESFVIAGWVGVWHAVELVLYPPWQLKTRLQLLDQIAAMEHRVRAG